MGGAREKLLEQLDPEEGPAQGPWSTGSEEGLSGRLAAKPAASFPFQNAQMRCWPHHVCVKFENCTSDEIKFYIQLVHVCSFSIKSKVSSMRKWFGTFGIESGEGCRWLLVRPGRRKPSARLCPPEPRGAAGAGAWDHLALQPGRLVFSGRSWQMSSSPRRAVHAVSTACSAFRFLVPSRCS